MNPRNTLLSAVLPLLIISGGYATETNTPAGSNQLASSSGSENTCAKPAGEIAKIDNYSNVVFALLVGITGSLMLAAVTSLWSVGKYRKTLHKRFREGDKESTLLLAAEGLELIDDQQRFIQECNGRIIHIENQINGLMEGHRETTKTIVQDFKSKLNQAFESFAVSLQKVADSSDIAKNEVAKSGKVLEQTLQLLDKKEKEISDLKEGFQKAIMKPLILSFIEMRDDFVKELGHIQDEGISSSLKKNADKVDVALNKLGMIKMDIPADPHSLPGHFWDTLEAAKVTKDESLQGKTSRVVRDGYYSKVEDGNGGAHDVVFRKATVEIYRYEPDSMENR